MKIDRYNSISKKLNKSNVRSTVKPFIPNPSDSDYENGYIIRYFVQSTNNREAPVYEVNGSGFSKFSSNPFFNTVQLDWRLIGDPDDVKKSNKSSIVIASKTLPKIKLYLPNLLQFRK